jgi:hypothetical protein
VAQPDATFLKAYDTVRNRYSADAWLFASPQQITKEIYSEMRRLDLIHAAKLALRPGSRKPRTEASQAEAPSHNIRHLHQDLRRKVA